MSEKKLEGTKETMWATTGKPGQKFKNLTYACDFQWVNDRWVPEMENKMTDFPNCRALGLEVRTRYKVTYGKEGLYSEIGESDSYVRASDLEALLAKGVRVYGESAVADIPRTLPGPFVRWSETDKTNATHSALLIDIQPIKRESAEDVLRDIVERYGHAKYERQFQEMVERARRVLGK